MRFYVQLFISAQQVKIQMSIKSGSEISDQFKTADSGLANTTCDFIVKKKFSIKSCQSSISVEDKIPKNQFAVQRKLFMKFISLKNHKGKREKIIEQMKSFYSRIQKKEISQFHDISQLIPSSTEFPSQYDRTFAYFIGLWLYTMGYKTEKNKRVIVQRMKLRLNDHQISRAIKFYQTLGYSFLTPHQRWNMLLTVCENGWESFCKIMCTTFNKDSEAQFLQQQ